MEPTKKAMSPYARSVRYVVPLGRMQVIAKERGADEQRVTVDMGNSVKGSFLCPAHADVRVGDYLTFYTEVLVDAQPEPTSIQ